MIICHCLVYKIQQPREKANILVSLRIYITLVKNSASVISKRIFKVCKYVRKMNFFSRVGQKKDAQNDTRYRYLPRIAFEALELLLQSLVFMARM